MDENIMKFIYAAYNQYCNSIDITTFDNMLLRIDCNKAEDGLKTTPNSQCALNALVIDEPLKYARLVLDGEMQAWINTEDSLTLLYVYIICEVSSVGVFYILLLEGVL